MKTILVTANDTEVGKTWLSGAIAKHYVNLGKRVQYVKPLETGVDGGSAATDEGLLKERCGIENVECHTLYRYEKPLAPTSAADIQLKLDVIVAKIEGLPEADVRIIEGVGGCAVPLDHRGSDINELLNMVQIDRTVIVIDNRLGSINQARLLDRYIDGSRTEKGFWLNDLTAPDPRVHESNLEHIMKLRTPIWGHQRYKESALNFVNGFEL